MFWPGINSTIINSGLSVDTPTWTGVLSTGSGTLSIRHNGASNPKASFGSASVEILGIYTNAAPNVRMGSASVTFGTASSSRLSFPNDGQMKLTDNAASNGVTVSFQSDGLLKVWSTDGTGGDLEVAGSGADHGQTWRIQSRSENLTLATGDVTSTTTMQIPAGATVVDVTALVTTTITTAVSWSVGVSGATTRYVNAYSTMTAGASQIGIDNPRKYTSATNLVVTTNANPGAGAIRLTVHYFLPTAATS